MEARSLNATQAGDIPNAGRPGLRSQGRQIEVENVGVTFPGIGTRPSVEVMRDVSLTIDPGEFVCLIGPSGCGKSTLLSLLAGYMAPTSGRLGVAGRAIAGPSPERVMVFQSPTLFPWRSVEQNIAFGLTLRSNRPRFPDPGAVVADLIRLVGLEGFAKHYPFELSGGMRQRVEIARALAVNPDMLLMDEPFGALDALTRLTLQRETLRIWEETRKTVLFVTHDISEAVILADRVVVFTHRPARVREIVTIDLPRPRHRDSADVAAFTRRIAELLEVTL
jgi:NitT/TauT family transport system ATP-binding protein